MTARSHPERRQTERLPPKEVGLAVQLRPLVPDRPEATGEIVNVSNGGLAVWTPGKLDLNSHWTVVVADTADAVAVKLVRTRPGFGGHVHSFKFSTPQPRLADKLTGTHHRW